MILNEDSIRQWRKDKGDLTLMLEHDLEKTSVVVDIGAYTGEWISQMVKRHDCNYYALEPVEKFYDILNKRFEKHDNVKCYMAGISSCNEIKKINISGDASSVFGSGKETEIILYDFQDFLKEHKIEKVDLVQVNIEGMEYEVLNSWLKNDTIKKIDKILIQFHDVEELNCIAERYKIQDNLLDAGFIKCFDYPFVWEAWRKKR